MTAFYMNMHYSLYAIEQLLVDVKQNGMTNFRHLGLGASLDPGTLRFSSCLYLYNIIYQHLFGKMAVFRSLILFTFLMLIIPVISISPF